MRRLLVLSIIVLAATVAMLVGMVGIAHANSCSFSLQPASTGANSVDPNGGSFVNCTGRFFVRAYLEFESGGTWHSNDALYDFNRDQNGYECQKTQTTGTPYFQFIADSECWGTSDGSGGGYWGAGNNGLFTVTSMTPNGNWVGQYPSGCGNNYNLNAYNWRLVVQAWDYNSNTQVGSNHSIQTDYHGC